jgi:hypothetical protein
VDALRARLDAPVVLSGLVAAVDPGVDPEGLLTFYAGNLDDLDPPARARYFREVIRRIEEVPGVLRAGACDYLPFQGEDDFMGFRLEDRPPPLPGQGPREEWRRVSAGYFEAAGLDIRIGRGFAPHDFEIPPSVAVVNEAFRRKYFRDGDVLGRRMRVALPAYGLVEVVGVVDDVPERGPAFPAPPTFFVPLSGEPRDSMALFVRVEAILPESIDEIREAVWSVDATQPIDGVVPMSALVAGPLYLPRLAGALLSQFAALALLLAGLGLYGVASHTVRSRRPELGVRLALGATPRRLKRDLLVELAPWALLGFASGAALGIAGGHAGRSLLYQVSPGDPGGIAATALIIAVLVLVSAWLPARSVARIDPSDGARIA